MDRVAEDMMLNFSESGHPVFRGSSALERGSLRSKGGGKLSIHFCRDTEAVEVALRTIISVNQFSVYGAVGDMCDEQAWRISGCSESTGKPVAQNNSEYPKVCKGSWLPSRSRGGCQWRSLRSLEE